MKELIAIQERLKVPKGQYNHFGKYKYRSAEDILEAVKPVCHENGCFLTLSDVLENVGERYYIKATATITNSDGERISVTAYAREEQEKKGMDGSQITGTASSYARKYALNGLFCIDDTKDADTDEYAENLKMAEEGKRPISKELCEALRKRVKALGVDEDMVCTAYDIKKLEDLPMNKMAEVQAVLNRKEEARKRSQEEKKL